MKSGGGVRGDNLFGGKPIGHLKSKVPFMFTFKELTFASVPETAVVRLFSGLGTLDLRSSHALQIAVVLPLSNADNVADRR